VCAISSLTSTFAVSSPDEFLLKVLTELNLRQQAKLQTVPDIYYSFTKEGAAYTRTVWFVEFIHMPSGMKCRAQDKKFIYINIDKPENNLITPDERSTIRRRNSRLWGSRYFIRAS